MIAGRRSVKPTDVIILNCLTMFCSGNSPDRNEDVAYMDDETGPQYYLEFCRAVVEIYAEINLRR